MRGSLCVCCNVGVMVSFLGRVGKRTVGRGYVGGSICLRGGDVAPSFFGSRRGCLCAEGMMCVGVSVQVQVRGCVILCSASPHARSLQFQVC